MGLLSGAVALTLSIPAEATTRLTGPYDARSVALGGTGVAYTNNPSGMLHNPATLGKLDNLSAVLGVSPFKPTVTSPITGPNTARESDSSFAPLFIAAGAYRVLDDVVVGIGFYPTTGFGGDYKNIDGFDPRVSLLQMELAVPVAYNLTENLSVAVGWRMTYLAQENRIADDLPGLGAVSVEQELEGYNFGGLMAGLHYRLADILELGFTYRSEVRVKTEGLTTTIVFADGQNLGDSPTTSSFRDPHEFRLGSALYMLDGALMAALDVRYILYGAANRKTQFTIEGQAPVVQMLEWNDVVGVSFGLEYSLFRGIPIRLGYAFSTSATPEDRANFFMAPPAPLHFLSAGLGYEPMPGLNVDAGFQWAFAREQVSGNATNRVAAGEYDLRTLMAAASMSFRM